MEYKEGDFVLIKDKRYKAKQFIGEIATKLENDNYNFYVYIFPEDTKEGRQSYMSSYEVFFTPTQTTHYLSGEEHQKVEVLSLEDYVDKKYFDTKKSEHPLYFFRQSKRNNQEH